MKIQESCHLNAKIPSWLMAVNALILSPRIRNLHDLGGLPANDSHTFLYPCACPTN